MKNFSFEFVESRNIGPFPCVQQSTRIDEEMAPVLGDTPSFYVGYFHIPLAFLDVPFRTRDTFLELTILPEAIFVGEAGEVIMDLI